MKCKSAITSDERFAKKMDVNWNKTNFYLYSTALKILI